MWSVNITSGVRMGSVDAMNVGEGVRECEGKAGTI